MTVENYRLTLEVKIIYVIIISGIVYKFQYGLCTECYFEECVDTTVSRSGHHVGILLLTKKRVQPRKSSLLSHLLLNCNYSPSCEAFSVLCHKIKKYLLELKEILFIMRQSINQLIKKHILTLSISFNEF